MFQHAPSGCSGTNWQVLQRMGVQMWKRKNVILLKWMKDRFTQMNPAMNGYFLHCIIHSDVLCKLVMKTNYVVDVHEGEESIEYIKAIYCTFGGEWDWTWWHRLTHGCQVAQPGLERVRDMRAEIHELFENKGKDHPALSDAEYKADLTFAVHMVHRISYLRHWIWLNKKRKEKKKRICR